MREYDRSPKTNDPRDFEISDPPSPDVRKRRAAEVNHPDQSRDEAKSDGAADGDKNRDGFQEPRHPQGKDTEVDRRHVGRGNQFGEAGRHARVQDRANDKPADPDDTPKILRPDVGVQKSKRP
ncbi:hypothetical protein [Pusillimonas sp. ANT_WB101]|uniref:hypothetical protein n=1 Tax=Pusillimonas sp. ANT_WB101 TaxID=2597356 RepID=UPI0011EEC59F|nr:hypothetical protein [Pusillimonas sp. ANT_WB101]KAA0910531.1 hypothetical protein FQ179_01195 [Pusillimonas sp. ANT_WB101]